MKIATERSWCRRTSWAD